MVLSYFLCRKENYQIMKKLFVCLIVCGFSLFTWFSNDHTEMKTELFVDNLEALASGEGSGNILCVGVGSVDCRGYKAEVVIRNLSLK